MKEACNPRKGEWQSTGETIQNIPDTLARFARHSGEVQIQTRKALRRIPSGATGGGKASLDEV